MKLIVETGLSRRQTIGTICAALGVTFVPSIGVSAATVATQASPMGYFSRGIRPSDLEALLAELRRTPRCLSVLALSGSDGEIMVWQEWQNSAAQAQFWSSYKSGDVPNAFQRLAF